MTAALPESVEKVRDSSQVGCGAALQEEIIGNHMIYPELIQNLIRNGRWWGPEENAYAALLDFPCSLAAVFPGLA